MSTYLDDQLTLMCNIAMQSKLHLCKQKNGVVSLPSSILVDVDHKITTAEYDGGGDPVEFIPTVLQYLFEQGIRRFDTIGFVAEIRFKVERVQREPNQEKFAEIDAGDLDMQFLTDPLSDIRTGLLIHLVLPSKETTGKFIPYGYDDWGMPVFDTSDTNNVCPASRAIPLMLGFVDYCKENGDGQDMA